MINIIITVITNVLKLYLFNCFIFSISIFRFDYFIVCLLIFPIILIMDLINYFYYYILYLKNDIIPKLQHKKIIYNNEFYDFFNLLFYIKYIIII